MTGDVVTPDEQVGEEILKLAGGIGELLEKYGGFLDGRERIDLASIRDRLVNRGTALVTPGRVLRKAS